MGEPLVDAGGGAAPSRPRGRSRRRRCAASPNRSQGGGGGGGGGGAGNHPARRPVVGPAGDSAPASGLFALRAKHHDGEASALCQPGRRAGRDEEAAAEEASPRRDAKKHHHQEDNDVATDKCRRGAPVEWLI
jgi:hypothetical protein